MMRRYIFPLIVIGLGPLGAQIILVRELLVVFLGNELSTGIILSAWLFCTGVGSLLAPFIIKKIHKKKALFIILQVVYPVLLFGIIVAVRVFTPLLSSFTGEIPGFIPVLLYSFLITFLPCILTGIMFVSGCSILDQREDTIGRVYILEASGSAAGGILIGIIGLKFFSAIELIFILAILFWLSAGVMLDVPLGRIFLFLLTGFLILEIGGVFKKIDQSTRVYQFARGYKLLSTEDSVYGNIAVVERGDVEGFYENGILTFSVPDRLGTEEIAHFPMSQCPSAKRVLLIGGSLSGVVNEILKYPRVEKVVCSELDPEFVRVEKEVLGREYTGIIDDPRVKFIYGDGRRFIKRCSEGFDVIIVNLPEPYNAQINRFYTREFFEEAKRIMGDEGIISLSVTGHQNYISWELSQYLGSIYVTLKRVFPEVIIIPGDTWYYIASKKAKLSSDWKVIVSTLKKYRIDTRYVRDYYLAYSLSAERMDYAEGAIKKDVKLLNTDFLPRCFFFDNIVWSSLTTPFMKRIFMYFSHFRLWYFLIPLGMVFLILMVRRGNIGGGFVIYPIFLGGFCEIGFQILLILGFQIFYGYVYYKIGAIFAGFMAGLALGGLWIEHLMKGDNISGRKALLFLITQAFITIYPLILIPVFYLLKGGSVIADFIGENLLFFLLPGIAGFLGGIQFPLANRIYLENTGIVKSAGVTYGMDLLGACIGAVLVSGFVLPVIGIERLCVGIFLLNLSALLLVTGKIISSRHPSGVRISPFKPD